MSSPEFPQPEISGTAQPVRPTPRQLLVPGLCDWTDASGTINPGEVIAGRGWTIRHEGDVPRPTEYLVRMVNGTEVWMQHWQVSDRRMPNWFYGSAD